MGGCANSKYAVDEDKQVKKEKKPFLKRKSKKEPVVAAAAAESEAKQEGAESEGQKPVENEKAEKSEGQTGAKAEKEDIDFIDREEAEKANAAEAGAQPESDEAKKEVTTYQTTVVKHTQKEGDELLQYLRDEAFKSLQNSLKNLNQNRTQTTTASSSMHETPETATDDSSQDLLQQIKSQVLSSLGKSNEELINCVLDAGAAMIKEAKVKNMNELEQELESQYGDQSDMVKKVINSTTGFLTAKGTEAGAMLSTILANANSGIQGIMNETEKTTVKVTRTVTEQVLSGGQLNEITKIIASDVPCSEPAPCFQDLIKNISGDSKTVKTGTTLTSTSTTVDETRQTVDEGAEEQEERSAAQSGEEISSQAEQVVNKVINAAVEIVNQDEGGAETSGQQQGETNVEIEEQSTVTTSTTKLVLNGDQTLDQVQSEFFKQGKQSAEQVVNKLNTNELVEIGSN